MRYFSILIFLWIQLSFTQTNKENKGLYYFKKAYKFDCNQKKDSAFYYYLKAEKQYKKEQNKYNQARVLLNISNLQSDQNDLISCENTLVKALKIFKNLNKEKKVFSCYNKLGVLLKNKEQFNKSQEYYNKALKIAKKLKKTKAQLIVLGNIAINYKEQKKYKKAVRVFNKLLKHDSIIHYPIKKARALNYIAYCNFKLNNYNNLPQQFYKAKNLYLTNNHIQGIITNDLFLSEYYLSKQKNNKAKQFLKEAYLLAKNSKKNANLLYILELLAKADTIKGSHYFNQYTKLNDSINKVQLLYKNQFARISYETKEKELKIKIQEATIKTKNKQQIMLFIILLLSVLTIFILAYFIQKLKHKNIQINNLQIEIRHRLKNNLAMVTRFINISKKKTNNTEVIESYNTLNGRVKSMKSIHELLYKNSKTDNINIKQVIDTIALLSQKAFNTNKTISIYTDSSNIYVNSKKAELIGLIINELITNAYKYAFVNKNVGNITVKAFIKEKNILLLITDDGVGFPKNFNFLTVKSYGLKLIKGLTKQLNGTVTFINTKRGSKTTINIPHYEKR